MSALRAALLGLAVGAVVLAAVLFGRYLLPGELSAGLSPAEDRPTAERIETVKPSYGSARDVYEKLWPTAVRCQKLESVNTTGNESEAAECWINDHRSRISIYPSQMDVADLLDRTSGRTAYGGKLEIVAGVNWTITISPAYSTTADLKAIAEDAPKVADVLGGAVMTKNYR